MKHAKTLPVVMLLTDGHAASGEVYSMKMLKKIVRIANCFAVANIHGLEHLVMALAHQF